VVIDGEAISSSGPGNCSQAVPLKTTMNAAKGISERREIMKRL